jgi:hypothetical protein
LAECANDPGVPITYHAGTDTYSLDLSATLSVADMVCFFCGGNVTPPSVRSVARCKCGFLDRCEQDPTVPIEAPNIMRQLRCVFKGHDSSLAIWYCPACGGRDFP